jgi:hypothetical protein
MAKEYAPKGDSDSPLASRRGNADPVDIDDSPLNLEFGMRNDYANPREPVPPVEEWREAVPPDETIREPQGPPGDRSPTPPSEPGAAGGALTDGEPADLAFKRLGKEMPPPVPALIPTAAEVDCHLVLDIKDDGT